MIQRHQQPRIARSRPADSMSPAWQIVAASFLISVLFVRDARPDERATNYALTCDRAWQSEVAEKLRLDAASPKVRRKSPHVLEVESAQGTRHYVDEPPYGELGSTRFAYCGYSELLKAHLIGQAVGDLFTGLVVFSSGARSLSAGHSILVSPDGKWILGVSQINGSDVEQWTVLDTAGRKLWSGYAGLIKKAPGAYDTVAAQYAKPRWTGQSILVADLSCCKQPPCTVTLNPLDAKPA